MRIIKISILLLASLTVLQACGRKVSTVGSGPEVEARVEKLLSQMTLAEKIGQMNQVSAGGSVSDYAEALRNGQIGSVLNEVDPVKINEFQRICVEESRLGIPLLVARDVIHGFHTVFPIPLGLAATFDPALVEEGARVAAIEATSQGVRWTFSPMLDIARDPRWGRIAEGSGEDTWLDSRMAEAMVYGYQGRSLDSTSMAACIKHFVGYGAAEGGRDYNSTFLTERQLRNVYLPPFEAAVKAGAQTLMTSFNDNDGVPSTGNAFILKDVLRNEWGFDGLVVTDWNSMGEMVSHGFGTDRKDVAAKAVSAGVDMDMMTFGFISHLEELVKSGAVKSGVIDDAVRNILRIKILLGLFENPYVDVEASHTVQYAPAHLEAARRSLSMPRRYAASWSQGLSPTHLTTSSEPGLSTARNRTPSRLSPHCESVLAQRWSMSPESITAGSSATVLTMWWPLPAGRMLSLPSLARRLSFRAKPIACRTSI